MIDRLDYQPPRLAKGPIPTPPSDIPPPPEAPHPHEPRCDHELLLDLDSFFKLEDVKLALGILIQAQFIRRLRHVRFGVYDNQGWWLYNLISCEHMNNVAEQITAFFHTKEDTAAHKRPRSC